MKNLILLIMFVSVNAFSFGGYYTLDERNQMELESQRQSYLQYQEKLQMLKYCENHPEECYGQKESTQKYSGPSVNDYINNGLNTRAQLTINRGDLDSYYDSIIDTNLEAQTRAAKVQAQDYYNETIQAYRNNEYSRTAADSANKRELARQLCSVYGYLPRQYRGMGLPDCSTIRMQTAFSNFSYMRRKLGYEF